MAEASTMTQSPGLASRDGDRLTVSYGNQPVAEFNAPYAKWVFAGAIELTDADGHKDRLAVVSISEGEIDYSAIIRRNGTLVLLDETIIASPDGRHIASGYGGTEWDSSLTVVDWAGDAAPVLKRFNANCAPTGWLGNAAFLAACARDEDDSLSTVAKITASPTGVWHLSEMRKLAEGASDNDILKTIKLREEDSRLIRSDPKNDNAYVTKNGYRRLVTMP